MRKISLILRLTLSLQEHHTGSYIHVYTTHIERYALRKNIIIPLWKG